MSSLIDPPSSLKEATVKSLPGTVYYVTDFITEAEEAAILEKVGMTLSLTQESPLTV